MNHYLITIAYDGTKYYGWQRLSNQTRTIQEILETTLSQFIGEAIQINGSGRTDAGVSALAQTADFTCVNVIKENAFIENVNQLLPNDIQIIKLQYLNQTMENHQQFHARKSAVQKHYRYRVALTSKANPFQYRQQYLLTDAPIQLHEAAFCQPNIYREYNPSNFKIVSIDMQQMQQCAQLLCGKHDFSAFTTDKTEGKNHVKTLERIDITVQEGRFPVLQFDFYGEGFLYHMVRILSGTLLYSGLEKIKAAQIPQIFDSKERKNAGPTLPSNALTLISVSYL